MASLSDLHLSQAGDTWTACHALKKSVLFWTDDKARVTCAACRVAAKIRSKPEKSAQQVADAGRVIQRAILKYGNIGLHQKKRRG